MWLEPLFVQMLNRICRPAPSTVPGLLVGHAPGTREDVVWPDRSRREHAVILGKTGTGKTYLLESLAWQLAQRREGLAFFDFHGDASLSLIQRLRTLPDGPERLVILDPSHPSRSAGINVLESGPSESERFRKVSELATIFRQRWGVDSFGARTEELLRNSLYTLATARCTLAEFPTILIDTDFRAWCIGRLDHPDVETYWRDRYEPLSEAMKAAFREPLLNRVTAFLAEPSARHLLSQPESTIDMATVMATGQWLIVRLPKGRLREYAHTLGNLLFAQIQFAALAREAVPAPHRRTFTLLADEVQNLQENDLSTLLTEGRKFGISVVTANQFWEQLPKELRGALLSAASHICFRISSQDAGILAPELNLERRTRLALELTQLPRGHAVGRFGSHHLSRFLVPPLPEVAAITPAEFDTLIAPVTRDRADVEAQRRRYSNATALGRPTVADAPAPVQEGHHGW